MILAKESPTPIDNTPLNNKTELAWVKSLEIHRGNDTPANKYKFVRTKSPTSLSSLKAWNDLLSMAANGSILWNLICSKSNYRGKKSLVSLGNIRSDTGCFISLNWLSGAKKTACNIRIDQFCIFLDSFILTIMHKLTIDDKYKKLTSIKIPLV